jgi:hypothetical protein
VRSVRPQDDDELEALIRKLISNKISSGQLDNAPLTLHEIDQCAASFANTLQGVFHPRISYPSDSSSASQSTAPQESPESGPTAEGSTPSEPVADETTEASEREITPPTPVDAQQGAPTDGGRPDSTSV